MVKKKQSKNTNYKNNYFEKKFLSVLLDLNDRTEIISNSQKIEPNLKTTLKMIENSVNNEKQGL